MPRRWAMPTLQLLSFTDIFTAVIHHAQGTHTALPVNGDDRLRKNAILS